MTAGAPVISILLFAAGCAITWLLMKRQLSERDIIIASKDATIETVKEREAFSQAKLSELAIRIGSNPGAPAEQLAVSASQKIDTLNARITAQEGQIKELSSRWRCISREQYIKFGQSYPHVIGMEKFTDHTFSLPVRIEFPVNDVEAQYYAQQLFGLFGFCAITTLMEGVDDHDTLNAWGLTLLVADITRPTEQSTWVAELLTAANIPFGVGRCKDDGNDTKLVRLRVGRKHPGDLKLIES